MSKFREDSARTEEEEEGVKKGVSGSWKGMERGVKQNGRAS